MIFKMLFHFIVFSSLIRFTKKKSGSRFASELLNTIQEAHKGKLIKNGYRNVSVQKFSRNALRVPLLDDEIYKIDSCSVVKSYDVSSQLLNCQSTSREIQISFVISVHFYGELTDGTPIRVDRYDELVLATIGLVKHEWQLLNIVHIE